jgi:hypothetical protein
MQIYFLPDRQEIRVVHLSGAWSSAESPTSYVYGCASTGAEYIPTMCIYSGAWKKVLSSHVYGGVWTGAVCILTMYLVVHRLVQCELCIPLTTNTVLTAVMYVLYLRNMWFKLYTKELYMYRHSIKVKSPSIP